MGKFFFYVGMLSLLSFESHALKLYLVSNHGNVGDTNQVLGIGDAISKLSPERPVVEVIDTKTLNPAEIKDKIAKDLSHEKVIYIGAGEGGITGLTDLTKNPNLITCLTSHMFLGPYNDKSLLDKVDFIALPTHVASDVKTVLGSKLIETIGVAHNRRPDMAVYEKWKTELPQADVYLGVYLGGDAPTQTNEMKFFTEDEGAHLADYVSAKVEELQGLGLKPGVLVLNGPRTGKHDTSGREDLKAHRMGKTDHVTESFAKKLADKGINYKVFDFQYNTPENKQWVSPYNSFDLIAGAVKATKGQMIVPGESTSVISETIDVMPSGEVLVYHNSSMNEAHYAHTASEFDAGRVALLEGYEVVRKPRSEGGATKPGAATLIAEKLLEASGGEKVWASPKY